MPCSGARAPRSLGTHPPKKVPTFADYLVFGGAAVDGAQGTFPQVILTRTPTFHGLAINAVTNESAKTPPSGRGAKVLQPQYSCRARRGVWKAPAHAHRGTDGPTIQAALN